MAIIMNMSNYEIERSPVLAERQHSVILDQMNLSETMLQKHQFLSSEAKYAFPAHLATSDIEIFLQNMQFTRL